MATYKQRTPYMRHASADRYSSENEPQTPQTSGTARQHSSMTAPLGHLYHNDDTILDKSTDQEWTSIRHTANARAKARQQQQYFDQQQLRTLEWQFVLGQHHRTTFTAGRGATSDSIRAISSDEYDEVLVASSTEPPSHLASPRAVDAGASGESSFEQSSVLGYSDLTSDGLDSVGDSELDVWSQDDDDSVSLFTPSFRRPSAPASPAGLSPTTSLFSLPRPSFAGPLSQPNSPIQPRLQNQMPLHDGSGNFASQSPLVIESGHESDHHSENIALGASPVLRQFDSEKNPARPRITSSEFASVIHNIANLQVQAGSSSRNISPPVHLPSLQGHLSDNDHRCLSYRLSSSESRSENHWCQTCPSNTSKVQDAYEQELTEMVSSMPSKLGWLQVFEHTLRVFNGGNDSEFDIMVSDATSKNAVKAWTICIGQNNHSLPTLPEAMEEADSESDTRLEEVRKNMASASMDTLRRLQLRKRSYSSSRDGRIFPIRSTHPLDPMQIDFVPTVMDQSDIESSRYPKNRRTTSRSTSTSTSHQDPRVQDSTLLSVFITTLRRLRDHVASNFIYHEYLHEDDNGTPSRGFEGDLGIKWATGGGASGNSASTLNSHDHHPNYYARRDVDATHGYSSDHRGSTTPISSSSSMSSSTSFRRTSNIRRVSSDCGLQSMRRYSHGQERNHRPRYVG